MRISEIQTRACFLMKQTHWLKKEDRPSGVINTLIEGNMLTCLPGVRGSMCDEWANNVVQGGWGRVLEPTEPWGSPLFAWLGIKIGTGGGKCRGGDSRSRV